jgi:hypothetical protein
MDISRTRVVLRERAVIDVLDLGVRFIVQHWAVYAKLAAIVLLPFFGASWLITRAWGPALGWLFALFTATAARAPFTLLASRLVFEDFVRLRAVLAGGLRAAPKLLVLRVMTFWFVVVMQFAVEVVALERAGVVHTVRRCLRIVGREPGPPIIASLLLSLLSLLAVVLADAAGRMIIATLLESHAPASMWESGSSTLALLGFWLFVPYTATARFFVYLDVRTRGEGWDVQTRFAALASRGIENVRVAA